MSNIICYLFSFIIEAIGFELYSETLFIPRHPRYARIILIITLFIPLLPISLLENSLLNAFLLFALFFIFLLTQCKISWYIAIFHSGLITALIGMTELVFYGICNFYNPKFLMGKRDFHIIMQYTIFSKLLYFLILLALIYFLQSRQQVKQNSAKSAFLLFIVPLISLVMMLSFVYYNSELSTVPELNWLVTICAVCLLILNLFVFGINQYNQKRHQQYIQMQLFLQKESDSADYYQTLVHQNEDQRVLIHDIRKHLASIDALNEAGKQDKIHTYIQQLQGSAHLNESLLLSDNQLLNTILYRYTHKCESQHISFHTDIRSRTVGFLADTDLTSLFCNLLDNALCAAETLPEAFVEICAYAKENSPFTIITVINSCRENPFTGPGGTLISNKADRHLHGLGLKSIRRVVDSYHGAIKMYYDLPTLTFHTILTLRPPQQ